ncbi:hypothetical protein TNCV_4241281 [Trichonephila clavipes]|nr:hypothetical protein TNCV_4241281 [Trichonephila clavipes]
MNELNDVFMADKEFLIEEELDKKIGSASAHSCTIHSCSYKPPLTLEKAAEVADRVSEVTQLQKPVPFPQTKIPLKAMYLKK